MTPRHPNQRPFQPQASWLVSAYIAGMLCLTNITGLLLLINTANAEPTAPTISEPVTTPNRPEPTVQKILGQWLTKEPLTGDMVMFIFATDGKGFLISGEELDGKVLARAFRYRLNSTPQPMHLDVILTEDATIQTVFEFTSENDLRIQMLDTYPGKTRPTALAPDATVFQRISDSTTLPPNTVLITPKP